MKGLKTGGRSLGVPNKPTQELFEICERHGVDVFEAMVIIIANDPDPDKRFDKLERVAKYLYPTRKAIDLSTAEDQSITINIKNFSSNKKSEIK